MAASIRMPAGVPLWSVAKLSTYFRNPMKHTQEQVETLARMMKVYGWTDPIIVDEKQGIMAGHLRYATALYLALPEVPVIEITHLSEEEKKAFIVGHNQIARRSKWDDRLLAEELQAVQGADLDLSLAAFSEEELAILESKVEASLAGLDTDSAYEPNTAPSMTRAEINANDIQRAAASMENRFSGGMELNRVICPHCGDEFFLDPDRTGGA